MIEAEAEAEEEEENAEEVANVDARSGWDEARGLRSGLTAVGVTRIEFEEEDVNTLPSECERDEEGATEAIEEEEEEERELIAGELAAMEGIDEDPTTAGAAATGGVNSNKILNLGRCWR